MKIEDMSESEQAELHAVLAAIKAIDGIDANLGILEQNSKPLEVVQYSYLRTCKIYKVEPLDSLLGEALAARVKAKDGLFSHLDEEFDPDEMK